MDLRHTQHEAPRITVTWDAGEAKRWGAALVRAGLFYRRLATVNTAAMGHYVRIQGIQSDIDAAKDPSQTEPVGITFETGASHTQLTTLIAVAEIAAADLLDDAVPSEVHAELMAGTFGDQVNGYYRPMAAQNWVQEGSRFAGQIPTAS